MRPDESEDVDRALKGLPAPKAPRTLLPRVMAAVDARTARTAPRPWLDWPHAGQRASVALVAVLAIGTVQLWPSAQSAVARSATPVIDSVVMQLGAVADRASLAVTVARAFFRLLVHPLSGYALLLVLVMGAACATFGAALDRIALGGHT